MKDGCTQYNTVSTFHLHERGTLWCVWSATLHPYRLTLLIRAGVAFHAYPRGTAAYSLHIIHLQDQTRRHRASTPPKAEHAVNVLIGRYE